MLIIITMIMIIFSTNQFENNIYIDVSIVVFIALPSFSSISYSIFSIISLILFRPFAFCKEIWSTHNVCKGCNSYIKVNMISAT